VVSSAAQSSNSPGWIASWSVAKTARVASRAARASPTPARYDTRRTNSLASNGSG
jgi:hypothetical protein